MLFLASWLYDFIHLLCYNVFGLLCTIGTLRLSVTRRQWQPNVSRTAAVTAAGSLWHECNAVQRSVVHVQRADNARRPDRHNPTDSHSGLVRSSSQDVMWLRSLRAGGRRTVFDWQLVAHTRPTTVGNLAFWFWHDRHSSRQCDCRRQSHWYWHRQHHWQWHCGWPCHRRCLGVIRDVVVVVAERFTVIQGWLSAVIADQHVVLLCLSVCLRDLSGCVDVCCTVWHSLLYSHN